MHPQAHAETRRASMPALDDDTMLTGAQVKAHCGNVSDMCLWRWMRDPRVQFPFPDKINGRNYWRLGAIRRWQDQHAVPRKIAA